MRYIFAVTLMGLLAVTGAWDDTFKATNCYPGASGYSYSGDPIDELVESRMPISMQNFVALIEKYESQHTMHNPDRIALAIYSRYSRDGYIFNPEHSGGLLFSRKDTADLDKQDVVIKVLTSAYDVPVDTFDHREECSMHYMTSHSTDTYPHSGIDDFWESGGRRNRRQAQNPLSRSSYALPPGVEPATHPIENGVIQTPYGPVALGTLLAGIASSVSSSEITLSNVLGDKEVTYMPDEMKAKRINPLYASTIAGDIGQTALKAAMVSTSNKYLLGPSGKFSNSTAAPKLFTQSEGYGGMIAYLTRAEIFAGIDAMLIQRYLGSSTTSTKLSQVLRMYYSDRGLPGFQDARACNRLEAYKIIKDDVKTKEQALNFMYAYSDYDPAAADFVRENAEDFSSIESYFTGELNDALSAYESFIGSRDADDFDPCPAYSSNKIKCESTIDLVVVYNREGGTTETLAEREYITLVAEMIGVGNDRSRLGVVDARDAKWIMPLTNVSNIADLGANFTLDSQSYGSGGSSTDMFKILDTLRTYYFDFYNVTNSSAQNATANSQVVLWNVPKNVPDFNNDENLKYLRDFRGDFPNVYFLLVGSNVASYQYVLADREHDSFKVDLLDTKKTAQEISDRICQIPSMFVYPACNTDIPMFTDYREDSHIFEGYLSPNFTHYAMLSPQNFKYSYNVKLTLDTQDVELCASRESMDVKSASDYVCHTSGDEFEWTALCTDRNLTLCKPIYLSITGTPSGNIQCTDNACEYPNQVEYRIKHEGLLCDGCSFNISLLLMAIVTLLHMLLV